MLGHVHVVESDGHGPHLPMLAQIMPVDVSQGFPTFQAGAHAFHSPSLRGNHSTESSFWAFVIAAGERSDDLRWLAFETAITKEFFPMWQAL